MKDSNNPFFSELHTTRQKIITKAYYFVIAIGALGGTVSVLTNNSTRKFPIWYALGLVYLSGFLAVLILYLTHKLIKNTKIIDGILFIVGVSLLSVSIYASTGYGYIALVTFFPLYLFLFAMNLNGIFMTIYVLQVFILLGFYMIRYPIIEAPISSTNYISFGLMVLASSISATFFIQLLNKFQQGLIDSNSILTEKNTELVALNEEYYAAQEELFEQYDQIQKLAFNDTLTGIMNRTGFLKQLQDHLPVMGVHDYVIYMDISGFSGINSAYGFDVGDNILKMIAKSIGAFKHAVNFYGRVGNDIFAYAVQTENFDVYLDDLQKNLPSTYIANDSGIGITFRLGVAFHEPGITTAEDLMKHADIALSMAKRDHVSYVLFDRRMTVEIQEHIDLKNALASAIHNRELHLAYQPIINAKTQAIEGYEALLRWVDKKGKFISPGTFIPVAEATNLMVPMGWLVVDLGVEFIQKLITEDLLPLRVSINISVKQLAQRDFAEELIACIQQAKLPANAVGVEITESVLIQDFGLVAQHMEKLRDAGISIYLDDFGTGFSSLEYLHQLPIDVLKIDKAFIDKVTVSKRKKKMLESILFLAKKLEVTTVAEGVETEDQYEMLRDMGIDYIQGYYFSKPLDEASVIKHYHNHMMKTDKN